MSGLHAQKIVAPIDFSEESFAALGTALMIAEDPSDVHVVHAIPALNVAEAGVIWEKIDDEARIQHALDELGRHLSSDEYAQMTIHVEIGDPGRCVTDFAKRTDADLIVMSSHGRTGLAHMLLGSVAERVVRLSHCPVLVLKK
jgi:nucleotide-binding universal stress UspA family protein